MQDKKLNIIGSLVFVLIICSTIVYSLKMTNLVRRDRQGTDYALLTTFGKRHDAGRTASASNRHLIYRRV